MNLDPPTLAHAYEMMSIIRGFELRAEKLFAEGAIRGSTHLAIGQEAVAVGARLGLEDGDLVAPTYRGHAYALAWGMPVAAAVGELLGRATGSNRGRGGSKHFSDVGRGVLPGNAIVAAALPIACGTALAAKLDGRRQVSLAPFGEGATNQAAFHEALNLAAIWQLPVIFLCENNLYSEMTPIALMAPMVDMADRAAAYRIPSLVVDGMDLGAVAGAVAAAAERARAGDGPTFIEAKTYRFCGHMPGDTEPYRTRQEVEEWRARDPIPAVRRLLVGLLSEEQVAVIDHRAEATLAAAETEARSAEPPLVDEIGLGTAAWMEADR